MLIRSSSGSAGYGMSDDPFVSWRYQRSKNLCNNIATGYVIIVSYYFVQSRHFLSGAHEVWNARVRDSSM